MFQCDGKGGGEPRRSAANQRIRQTPVPPFQVRKTARKGVRWQEKKWFLERREENFKERSVMKGSLERERESTKHT